MSEAKGDLFRRIFLDQPGAQQRLVLARCTTGMAALRTLWHMPPPEVVAEPWVTRADRTTPGRLSPAAYRLVRLAGLGSVAAWTLGFDHPVIRATANVSFALAQRHIVTFHEKAWNYNSHLNVFLGLLSVVDSRGGHEQRPAIASAAVGAMQAYYAASTSSRPSRNYASAGSAGWTVAPSARAGHLGRQAAEPAAPSGAGGRGHRIYGIRAALPGGTGSAVGP